MTSTNDGKEVKSYQTSGPKGKLHYIELYKSLEARLSEVCEASVRTQHLCEAWYQVHTLCLHSSATTHPHLLSWLQKHTARTILQTKWQSPERKDDRATLETAINGFIAQCQQASSERESFLWETELIARGEWFKRVLDRPWDHPVLNVLLNPCGAPPTDDEVLSWLVPERGVTFVMRLLTLVSEKCEDIAASLTAAVMDRVRARVVLIADHLQIEDKDKSNQTKPALSDFGEKLSSEAGFTPEVWELLTDIEFVLLYKRDRSRCIALAKQTPLQNAYHLVERLHSRLELTPREKKLWKNAKDVAVLISEVVITRCMVIPVCAGVGRYALYRCSRSLARALGPKLPSAAVQLGAPAASARHLHTLATAIDAHFTQNNDQKMKPFVCELYVRAITAGMNELERLKIKTEKESEARQMEQTLASWFVQLGAVLSSSDRIRCECTLTAFSVHPSMIMYERIKAASTLPKSAVEIESPSKEEPTSEFGSWASDSRSQTNFVKTSETLNMKKTQNQANVLSTAILNEGEALGLSPDLCHDIAVLLSGPRVKTLSWDMDREQLIEKCRVYMERTHGGTRALTTELKYLNLDPNEFMHLPEEDDDENDLYYGIEKGYEHLVQFQDPEDIWKDTERTESAHSTYSDSDIDVVTSRRKKTGKKLALSSDDDADPLSKVAETQRNEKKERPHSKERSKERKKKELRDPLEINPPKEKKEKLPKKEKEKKERKKKVKSSRESLAKLIGIKVIKQSSRPTKAANTTVPTSFVTDSDYDSQGKSSFTSVNSEPTDVLYDGLFSMDELKSPERGSKHSENIGLNYNEFNVSNDQVGLNYPTNRFQNNQPILDSYRKPVTYLSHSSNVVSDEVKKNLGKLIENRRQVATSGNQSPIPPNIDLDNSITAFRSYKTMVSKNISTQTPQKVQNAITRPKTPLQTCISPKAVAIPEIPKSIINKDSQRMVQIKKDVEDYLQRCQRNLNDTSIPSPVIQYAKKNDDTPLQHTNPFKMSDLVTVPQERFGPYDTKPVFTQSRPGGSVHRPPIRESAGELNYQKFLAEFQRSVDEKYNKSLKKEIKPVSRVPPVIPNVIKAETKTPQRAKPIPQQKKPDNSLNTFSRLSYMHKNKQMDIKNKLTEPSDHGNVSRVSFETKIGDFVLEHLRKSSQNQSYSVETPKILNEYQNTRKPETSGDQNYPMLTNMLGHSQIGNANINTSPTKPILKLNASSPNSYLSEKDQNDLIILLRQQSKFNATAPPSRPMNLKTYPTYPPQNVSEKNVNNHFAPSTSAASNTNTFKKPVNENKQINVISTSIIKPANSAPGAQNTIKPINVAKKNIKVDVQEKSKNPETLKPRILGKAEVKKSEDWQAVMNAIRAQKTPSRGPNALDMALNKSSFEKAFEDSLRRNEFSEQDSKIDANALKTDKPQLTKHSTVSVDFATRDNSKSKTYNRPKVSNNSAESTKNESANKYMTTKNLMQKKANNIDLSQKTPAEQPKKKLPYTGNKGDDPFISGIPNSDYDLIEELMDDDLRKEIGELSSDEDYSTAAADILKPTKPTEKRVSVIYNKTLATTPALQKGVIAYQTNRVQPQKCIYENKAVGPPKPVHRQCNAISKTYMKVSSPSVTAPSCSSETHVFSNSNTYVQNSIAMNSNVYINAVPQPPVQKVVLIGSNVVYEGYTNVQRSSAVTNMIPNAYVALNNVPNMTSYQSTQYAAPVINPVIIESAMTMPVVNNIPCSIPVQTNAVNNLIHSECSTNKEIPSVQEYSQPTVACEVSKIESRPNYNFNEHPLMNDHAKTDVNMPETNLNKNSERKVLSEVQEKQVFSQGQEKQVVPEVGEHKEKSKRMDYNKIVDQERLRKKRIAIMNRKILHYSERKPIALGYAPIFPVVQNTLSKSDHNCESDFNMEDQKTEAGLEVASPASQDSMDNCKENKDNALTCRRILLRSSNTLKAKVPNDTDTKIADKNTKVKAPNIAKESDTGVAKTVEGGPKRNRVSKQLRHKPIIKEKQKQKPKLNFKRRLKLNLGKNKPLKIKFNKVIDKIKKPADNIDCSMNFIDIEAELVGSKIPKTCKVDNAQDDEKLFQSVSQNDDNYEKPRAGIDRDSKVATRRSSRLAGNANTQLTKDIREAEKLASMSTEVEVYVPILTDDKTSIEDSANLLNINVEEDGTSIVTVKNDALNQTEPLINNFDKSKIFSKEGKDKNIPIIPLQELAEPVTKLAKSSINNEPEIFLINDGLEQKVKKIKTGHDSVVTSNDKSVNVDYNDITETIEQSVNKLPTAAKEDEVEKEKHKTSHDSGVTSNNKSVSVDNNDITETIEQSVNKLPTAAKEDEVEKEKHKTSHDSGVTSNNKSVSVDNIDMTETIEESVNILSTTAKEDEVKKEKDKTCRDSVVSSNDKSVNVNNSDMIESIEESGNKLPTAAEKDKVEMEKDKTCHDSVVSSNDKSVDNSHNNMIETIEESSNLLPSAAREDEVENRKDGDVTVCSDVIKPTNDFKTVDNRTENNVNLSDIPQSFKDSIQIDHIPNQKFDDPLKQCVRIKLPNGRVFKATVFGQLNVDFDSLFEEPSIKSVLLNSLTSKKKNFTLNVKQTTTASKHDLKVMSTWRRQMFSKNQGQIIDTVNLLSDDEEISQEFTTEYGKFKIQPIDTEVHKMHQNKFKQKSAILLKRCDHKKDKSLLTNAIDLTCKKDLSNDNCIQLDKLESPTVISTKSIENIIESVKATWEKLKENVSSNSKVNEKIINAVYSKGNVVDNNKTEEGEVVLIEDSSSEDELLNICNKNPKVINVLANKLLIDMGVGVPNVPKIDDPIKSNHISSMPIEIPKIDLTKESSILKPASKYILGQNIEKCYVKLVRCDHLVNVILKTRKKDSTQNITDVNAGKTTDIVKENTTDHDVGNTETNIDANKHSVITIITDLDKASSKPRSRSNSFSILDDFPILNDIDMQCTDDDRSSPVIEAFDLIASYEHFLKPKLKSPQIMPLKCDSDWFATKRIQSYSCKNLQHSDSCKNLQDVTPAIPLCCDSEWFTTKDVISKQIMINSSDFEPITVLLNADIEETSQIEVPSLTSLALEYLQNIDLLDNLQPISSAHNLIPGTFKRKLVPSNEVSTPKKTKLNISNKTNAQINSSTDSDLTDMSGETIFDENSTTLCNDTQVLLESAECITATNDILSECVNVEYFDSKTDVALPLVANQVLEEQVILNYSDSVVTTNAIKPINVVYEGASKSNKVVYGNMQIDCNAEKSNIIDVCKNDILSTVEDSDLSAVSGDSENRDCAGTITNPTCEETNNVMCENKDNSIMEQPEIVKKYEPSNKLTQEDSNTTDISGDSGNLKDSKINEQLDTAETCKSKSAQTLENINDDCENSITDVVNDLITKPVLCENMDKNTTVHDVVEMYVSKIAQDDIFVAAVSNDTVNENEVKEITDVICEEIMKSNCVTRGNIDNSEAKECKIIERSESKTALESKLGNGINMPAVADNTKNEERSLEIKSDLLLSEELNKGSKTIEESELSATISTEEETVANLPNVKFIHADVDENSDVLEEKPILNNNDDIGTISVSYHLNVDKNKADKCEDQADASPASSDSALNWEMSIVTAEENTVESLPALPNNTTLLTKYLKLTGEKGSEIILKGIEYVDAEAGSCYMFPLVEQSTSTEVSLEIAERDDIMNLIREATDGGSNDKIEDILDCDTDLKVSLPKNTYSKIVKGVRDTRNLKRKRDMSDVRLQEKKYRKGKNIDYPKITVAAMNNNVYVKEYKRLIDYYSTLKFSYSRPFHKENIDVDDMIKDWPLRDVQTNANVESVDVEATIFTEEDKSISPKDPLEQTLAQELNSDYNETEYKPSDIIETNFSMGFGEGSGRVIQHSKTGKISKLSAATLSDVKPHQPYLSSESSRIKIENTHKENNNEKTKLIQNLNFIQLKQKVRSFFYKTATELTYDFMKEQKKCSDEDTLNFPFELTSTDFFDQFPHEVVVNIVQVGQLPVSAAAQNPVTCDPRVTHVSNVSPSQCSAENSPGDDNQTSIKTEYTELTTADITLPLVQEYAQHHQFTTNDTQEPSKTHESDQNICISTEINSEIKIELTEETSQEKIEENDSYESEPLPVQSGDNVINQEPYSYNEVPNNLNVESQSNRPTMPDETKMSNTLSESKDEENVNKTDQLAHAMNAAGITTSSNTIHTTNADALVDIISQNAQSDVVTTTQINTNNYSKSTPINAVALQQALAQILPPPLSQTSASESGQTSTNAVAPPVLHIVQGSNSQTVLNTQNGTPLLHIVQNKSATNSNGTPASQANSFGGLSLVDTGLQQGGNQLLHIVNTGNQKNNNAGQLLKRVNLLTNITNVQGSNEQKMVQFVCKSADGKSIQLNAPHQRSMVLRLQAIDPSTIQPTPKPTESQDVSANSGNPLNNKDMSQQEIKSRSVYEENYAKFIQNGTGKPGQEKATSLPKFNQVFGKQVSYQENKNEINNDGLSENTDGKQNNNLHIDQINEINNPPLLLRKSTAQTSQAPTNLVQQIKQTIAPMNIQTMHGGVIYTRQIPVNIGGGQTINLITVPSTELVDDASQKQQTDNKFTNQDGDHVIKIVQNQSNTPNAQNEDNNNAQMNSNDAPQAAQPQPVLTQMRIKLPMLSKTPQMVAGARVVRPSFFQIQRNVIGGANQPVYQQLVLTTAPPLGQSIRVPAQGQSAKPSKPPESQSSPESQMSSSTLEQLREFDMVLEQVKERSTVQPGSTNSNSFSSIHSSADTTDSSAVVSTSVTETTQQVLYTTGNQTLNIASYVNRKSTVTSASTSFVRSPDSSGIVESPSSSTHNNIPHTATSESTSSETSTQPKPKKKKSRPSSSATSAMKLNTTPPKTSTQKPLEDEQTTQRILYILAEYKEQVENSPDKDKPAPRRRNNLPPNIPGSSKRKKSSSGSRRRDMSPILGEDSCRTMGSEDSSCGTSLGECAECMESHSPQESPKKVVRRLTFEQETTTTTQVTTQTRTIPQRNVIVADGQTITVARGPAGKPATTVLMPANYLLPVSMVKGGQQIAIVTNRGPKLLVGGGEGGTGGTLLFQRLIGPAGLKPVLTRPGVRHIRLPTAALHNLQAFNLASAAAPVDSTASPAPAAVPAPPDLVDSRAMSSPWSDRDTGEVKPERGSSPEGSEPWNLPSSSIAEDYGYEEIVRTDNMDRTVLDAIPDRYSPDMEAQRIFDKMFDVDSKKSMYDSSRCGYDIDASDTDDRPYQVVQRKDGRHHRLTHVTSTALRHKYAILEHELRLQKSLSEECEDLGVDSPSASELFPEAELLFAPSPVHEQTIGPCHTPQPTILNQGIPQPDLEDQIATDHLLTHRDQHSDLDINLDDVGEIVTVGEDGMAMIPLDHEEFARSHPNTTFHTEPEDGEIPPFTIAQSIKGRQITFHASRGPSTVVMAPQTTVISQATVEASGTQNTVKFTDIDNMINSIPSTQHQMPSVLVKDDGLTRFDSILTDSRELHLSNTASAIVHSTGQGTQVIRRVRYDENRRESRYLIDEPDPMEKIDDNRDLESMAGDDNSSSERHPELFWESNSASERSEGRRRIDFSSDSDKCCKSPFDDSTDSSFGNHMRLDSVIKAARTERSGSDGSSDDHRPLRTYPAKRTHHHPIHHDAEQSLSGKTRAGERCMDVEGRRRASNRGVVKRGCHCCNGSPAPPKPKKSRPKKTPADFTNTNNN